MSPVVFGADIGEGMKNWLQICNSILWVFIRQYIHKLITILNNRNGSIELDG